MSFSASEYTVTVKKIVAIVSTHMHPTATFNEPLRAEMLKPWQQLGCAQQQL